jgi:hypothetical protein
MGPLEIKFYGFAVKSNDVLKVKKNHDEASVERQELHHWQSFVFTDELHL